MRETDRYESESGIQLTEARNGAVLATDLRERARANANKPGIHTLKVTDNVYTFVGASVINRTFIMGPEGVVLYDTGESHADGVAAYEALRRLTDAPIRAVMYSHNHYCYGTPAFDVADDALIIGHPKLNANVGSPPGFEFAGNYPEAAPVLRQRFNHQFGAYLPDSGPDSRWGTVLPGDHGLQPTTLVTRPVEHGEELTVAGIRMQFFTDFHCDSDDQLIVWLPEHRVVLNNFVWPTAPNFAPLRGDQFRDPKSWINALRLIRDLEPEYLVNTHGRPVSGIEECRRTLNSYGDAMQYFVDQTLRGINKGMTATELRQYVELPEQLTDDPRNSDTYGEMAFCPPQLYHHIFGWFDGLAENIHPPTPDLAAKRTVEGFGGRQSVIDAVSTALQSGELSWAADLGAKLVRVHRDEETTALLAQVLRRLGQVSGGSIGRHFYLARALELEGRMSPAPAFGYSADTVTAHAIEFLDQQRVRLDPAKAERADMYLLVELTDMHQRVGLHVRHSICEFVPDPSRYARRADTELRMDSATWAQIYLHELDLAEAIDTGAVSASDGSIAVEVWRMFDHD